MSEVQLLSHKEALLWRSFQAYLNQDQKTMFTADDLLNYFNEERLDEVFKDRVHDVGLWFLKLLRQGEIQKAGTTYGRYNREIKQYTTTK